MDGMLWIGAGAMIVIGILVYGKIMGPRWLIKQLVFKSGLGLLLLLAVNAVGSLLAVSIPVNAATVGMVGLLGIPGLALAAYVCYIIT